MRNEPESCKGIYALRNKASGEFIRFGMKSAWGRPSDAKLAWQLHMISSLKCSAGSFDKQDEYEIVDLLEAFYRLEGLYK